MTVSSMRARWVRASLALLVGLLALGWGGTGHRFINTRAAIHLPASMQQFIQDSTFFGDHASDADARKGSDPSEGPKHYIDLEYIPAYENLTRDLDSLIAVMGPSAVNANGTLPWATADAYDSLVAQLARGDWSVARLSASDLGHYVADGHNPLHLTNNYNGQLTGNTGIHSRYESGMINVFQDQLGVETRTVGYLGDPFAFVLAYCIAGNALADSIIIGDDAAKAASGWTGSGSPPAEYTAALWQNTQHFTRAQMQQATEVLASLWYSAWVDAGLLTLSSTESGASPIPFAYALGANYPNPFNPGTTIWYSLPVESIVSIVVYDMAGREVAVLFGGLEEAGKWSMSFDASGLASGVYIYRLQARALGSGPTSTFVQCRRMVLLR